MNSKTSWMLAVSGGILAGLPWWGFPWLTLMICFVPLLLVEDDQEDKGEGSLSVLPFSFVFFLVWNIIVTWWMARIHPAGGMSVIILNAALMSLVFYLYAAVKKNTGGGVIVFMVLWTAFEFIHHHGDLSWPWLSLGNGLAGDIRIIQWYEYTGMQGGTVWVLLSNSMLYSVIRQYMKGRLSRGLLIQLILLTGIWVLPAVISINIFNSRQERNDETGFLILQPVMDPYGDKFSEKSNSQRLDQIFDMAERNIDERVDFIVTPETSVDSIWIDQPDDSLILRIEKFMARYHGTIMVMGATSFSYVNGSERSVTSRKDEQGNNFEVRNSALYFVSGNHTGTYHKHYLANGVEQVPFQKYLRFLGRFSVEMGGVSGSMNPGTGPEVFRSPLSGHPVIGTIICFESSYGEYSAAMAEQGAEIIVVISNDGWFKNTGAYQQHLRLSQIRAVETRRDVVRAANTGISCHISGRGDIIAELDWWEKGSILVHPSPNNRKTFYTGSGDYLGRAALYFSLLLLLNHIIKKYISSVKKPLRFNIKLHT